jgi:signal transduction histidine kinase
MSDDPAAAIPSVVDEATTQPVSSCRQILIVGDQPENVAALAAALAPMNRPTVTAASEHKARARLQNGDFSLVLLDVRSADGEGFEMASVIRADERTKHLPIIFVAEGQQEAGAIVRAYRLGAVDLLHWPIEPEILLSKASMLVTLQERTEQLATERLQRDFDAARRDYETETLRREMEHEQAAKEELARLNAALAEGDRRKNSFLAILGHELRNPLAPIRTAIDLIKASLDQPVSARVVDVLDRQTSVMTRLVEDLLDLSRITTNKIELRPERADLRTIVETAIATSQPAIEQRQHELSVTMPEAPVPVVVDQVRFVQVITNVLNNAARYTEANGKIAVACGIEEDRAFVRVTDTGIGIPEELLSRIFDMFVQERVRSDGSGGLGLGLALARQLVEMHHGTIRAISAGRGAGSTFEIQVPLLASGAAPRPRTRSDIMAPLPPPATALRAVVVDDNDDARELLADLLRAHGHEVITAEDGHQGLALIREHRPDVALVDLGLPGLDGVSLAVELRKQCPELNTRLIAVTGYGHAMDLERTTQAGFHAHLVKPATATTILAALGPTMAVSDVPSA